MWKMNQSMIRLVMVFKPPGVYFTPALWCNCRNFFTFPSHLYVFCITNSKEYWGIWLPLLQWFVSYNDCSSFKYVCIYYYYFNLFQVCIYLSTEDAIYLISSCINNLFFTVSFIFSGTTFKKQIGKWSRIFSQFFYL